MGLFLRILNYKRVLKPAQKIINIQNRMKSSYQNPNLDEIKQQFRQFTGGQVTINKIESDIALICIDHSEKKNGFSGKMMVELNEAVTSLENWTNGKGLILYGKDDMFCSGGYLNTVREITNSEDGFKMASLMHDTFRRLEKLPLVSVSLIHGKALGGGAELILWTDYRLMSSNARIAFVEAKMGVGTGWGGGYLLTRLVGQSKALDLLLTCKQINAQESLNIGLVHELIPPEVESAEETRLEYAVNWLKERVNNHEPSVIRTMKQIVQCQDLDKEREIFASSWGGTEQLKALRRNIKHK